MKKLQSNQALPVDTYYKFGFIYLLASFLYILAIYLLKIDFTNIIFYKHLEYFVFLSGFVAYYYVMKQNNKRYFLILSFVISIIIKLSYGFWHYYLFGQIQDFPMSFGADKDEFEYYSFAKDFLLAGGGSIFDMAEHENFPINYMGYPYLLYLVFNIFGVHTYLHIMLNSILMSLAIVVLYMFFIKVFRFTKNEQIIMMAMLVFSPTLTFFSITNVKDSLLLLELALAIYFMHGFVFFSKNIFSKLFFLAFSILFIYLIYFSRAQFSFLMFLYLIIMVYYQSNKFVFFMFFAAFVFYITTIIYNHYEDYEVYLKFFSYEFLEMQFERMQEWSIFQNKLILMVAPIVAPFAIFLPLPLKVHFESNSAIVNMNTELWLIPLDIELTFLYAVIVLNFRNILKLLKSTPAMKAYKTFLIIFLISLYITNYITYERHKLLLTMMSMPLFVKSFSYVLDKKSKQLLIVLVSLATLSFFYSIIRASLKGEI